MDGRPETAGPAGSPGAASTAGGSAGPTNDFEPFRQSDVEQSVQRRFEEQVRRHGDRTAVRSRGLSLTYHELNEAANRIAHAILDRAGDDEQPVVLFLDQTAMTIAAVFGALKAGKTYAPIDPRFPPARVSYMIGNLQPPVVITDSRRQAAAAQLAPGIPAISVDALDSLAATADPQTAFSPERGACIVHTSGSTGMPKGVLHSHRGLLFETLRITNTFHVSKDDRLGLVHSCTSSASLRRIFPALLNGASLHILDLRTEKLENRPAWFADEKITIANGRRLLSDCKHLLTGPEQFPFFRVVTYGGEPTFMADVELCRRFLPPDCLMLVNFATSETGSDRQFFIDRDTELPGGIVPIGYPVVGTEILLLDDDRREVPRGEAGEIVVKSRYLAQGYWNKPELTAQRFLADPAGGDERIYLTGDVGRMAEDGLLFYLGRKDFQVKVRGYRIEAFEVESALLGLGAFSEALVLALTPGDEPAADTARGAGQPGIEKVLVAYLTPLKSPAPTVSEIRRSLAALLPDYMIPSIFVMLDRMPRAASGKIDRAEIAAHFRQTQAWRNRPDVAASFAAPRNSVETLLAGIWAEVLGLDAIGVDDSFLELGGDSLKATRALSLIRSEFKVDPPGRALFDAPTVALLAGALVAAEPHPGWVEEIARLRLEIGNMPAEDVLSELKRKNLDGQ